MADDDNNTTQPECTCDTTPMVFCPDHGRCIERFKRELQIAEDSRAKTRKAGQEQAR